MTRARNLANLGNKNAITADIGLFNIGIGSTQPTSYKLEVVGGDAYIGGGVTITGNLSIGGTVTYEDVTNIDSVGIITTQSGVNIVGGGLTCVGVATFFSASIFKDDVTFTGAAANVTWDKSTDDLIFNDNAKAIFGTSSSGLEIYHDGSHSRINSTDGAEGRLIISGRDGSADAIGLQLNAEDSKESIICKVDSSVDLYFNASKKFETTHHGAIVTGILTATGNVNTGPVLTATGTEGISASLYLIADDGDDNGDGWRFNSNQDDNDLTISNNTTGSYVDKFTLLKTGELTLTSDLTIGDKIIHAGDTDTAIRFPSSNTITAETGGSSRFKIDSDGNVTIGNDGDSGSGPSAGYDELVIEGGNEDIGMCFLSPAANTVTQQISFGDSNNNQVGRILYNHASDYMAFHANNGERVRITSAGLVGINTATPSAMLSFGVKRSTQTYPPICFQTENGNGLADAAISTTDDSGGVDIMMGSNVYMGQNGAFTRYFASYGSAAVRCQYSGNTIFYNKSGNNAPEESMRINGDGEVGIGTNNPTKILDVLAKDGVTQPYIEKQSGSTNNTYQSALTLSARSTGAAAANYGPAVGFQHAFGGSNYAGCLIASQCGSDTNTASLTFYPRNYGYTEAMRINHLGRVGIGTDNPDDFLHVENGANTSNTYIHVQNSHSGGGNAGVKLQNANGEWTLIANNKFRIIDDDNSQDALTIEPGTAVSGNRCLRFFGAGATGGSFASASTAGDFEVHIKNLQVVNGNNWRPAQLFYIWRAMEGNANSNNYSLGQVRLAGLSTWSWSANDHHHGSDLSPAIDTSDDTTTSCTVEFTSPGTNATGTVWVWCSCYNAAPTVEISG